MSATILEIVEKVSPAEPFPAVPQNFILREGGSIPAQIIVENPNVSLYCLDDDNRRALFVEVPPGTDLINVPFFYLTQYQQAQRVIAVPYDEMHQLAADVPIGKVAFIYSVGRCGSTLISQALNEVEGVVSLSEPDVYTQITMLRYADGSRDAEYARLLESCTRLLCRGNAVTSIKFRALAIHLADLLYEVFPQAPNLFLYRHAESWTRSMNAAFSGDATPMLQNPLFMLFLMAQAPLTAPYIQRHQRPPELVEVFTLLWLSILDKYLTLHAQGIPFLALRYEELVAQPQAALAALFDHFGLPRASIEAAYGAFSKDSQEGTVLSRDHIEHSTVVPLTAEGFAQLRAVLQEHPVIQSSDFIVPDTVMFQK
jgi:hypothetical protein